MSGWRERKDSTNSASFANALVRYQAVALVNDGSVTFARSVWRHVIVASLPAAGASLHISNQDGETGAQSSMWI
jgi:hypothetical protein